MRDDVQLRPNVRTSRWIDFVGQIRFRAFVRRNGLRLLRSAVGESRHHLVCRGAQGARPVLDVGAAQRDNADRRSAAHARCEIPDAVRRPAWFPQKSGGSGAACKIIQIPGARRAPHSRDSVRKAVHRSVRRWPRFIDWSGVRGGRLFPRRYAARAHRRG